MWLEGRKRKKRMEKTRTAFIYGDLASKRITQNSKVVFCHFKGCKLTLLKIVKIVASYYLNFPLGSQMTSLNFIWRPLKILHDSIYFGNPSLPF